MWRILPQLFLGLLIIACGAEGAFLNMSGQEVLLMTGGGQGADPPSLQTAEMFIPSTGESHYIHWLPNKRISHTMDGEHLCGSLWVSDPDVQTTCLKYSPSEDQWTTSYTLEEKRVGHSSWMTDKGLLLMGGWYSPTTSEIVPVHGGDGGPSFTMKHRTKYACTIPDLTDESVILTGGGFDEAAGHLVQRYNKHGHVEDLPPLIEARMDHGCGAYLRDDGTQVLLIAGGMRPTGMHMLSTEILVGNSGAWTTVTPLPTPSSGREGLGGIKGARIGNTLYMTGGYDGFYNHDEILEWRDEDEEWVEVGRMMITRAYHSLTAIKIDEKMIRH